ncbi:MAG: hypothetical protein ACK559_14490, partial [bacterium]
GAARAADPTPPAPAPPRAAAPRRAAGQRRGAAGLPRGRGHLQAPRRRGPRPAQRPGGGLWAPALPRWPEGTGSPERCPAPLPHPAGARRDLSPGHLPALRPHGRRRPRQR